MDIKFIIASLVSLAFSALAIILMLIYDGQPAPEGIKVALGIVGAICAYGLYKYAPKMPEEEC